MGQVKVKYEWEMGQVKIKYESKKIKHKKKMGLNGLLGKETILKFKFVSFFNFIKIFF